MLKIYRWLLRCIPYIFVMGICVLLSSAFIAPQSTSGLVQLSNDNNIAAAYHGTWQQGDLVGAVLMPQNEQYPIRISSIEFILDNRFAGADNTSTVRGCIYSLSNGLPGKLLGCSAPAVVTTFFPNFISLSLEPQVIIINAPHSFLATVEYLAGASGKTPSIINDSTSTIPHGKNFYSTDGGLSWLEHYDFWLQPTQIGFNIIRATIESRYGLPTETPTSTPTRLLAPTRTPTPIVSPTITPTALPPAAKAVCPLITVSNGTYLPFITASRQQSENNGSGLPSEARVLGLKNYWPYAAMDVADHELLVNLANGNLLLDAIDQYLPSPGIEGIIGRTYNSLSSNQGEFGKGWSSNLGNSTRLMPQSDGSVILYSSSGSIEQFTASGGGFIAPPGFHYALGRNPDSSYRLISIGDSIQYHFDKQGSLRAINDRNGNTQSYQRNDRGVTTIIIDSIGQPTTITYSEQNQVSRIADRAGRSYQYRYDDAARLTHFVNPAGYTTEYHYDICGKLAKIIDAASNQWTIDYDAQGRVVLITDPLGAKTQFTYQPTQTIVTDANGHNSTYQVDAGGKLQKSTDANGNSYLLTWDEFANITTVTTPLGHTTQLSWDGNTGLLLTETDASGNRVTYTYDSLDNLSSITDANGNVTRFEYDSVGANLVRIDQPDSTAFSFTYDSQGNILTATDPNGNARDPSNPTGLPYRSQYNNFGYLTDAYDPLGNHWSYAWDNATGNLLTVRDAKGQLTEYTYNNLDQPTSIRYADGEVISLTYDILGNLITMTDGRGTSHYTYDAAGQLLTEDDPRSPGLIQYAYDAVGNLIKVTREDGALLTFNYDPADRLNSQSNPFDQNRLITYHYDADDRLTNIVYPNGDQTTYGYYANDWLKSLLTTGRDNTLFAQYDYPSQNEGGYDANGNPLNFTRTFALFNEQGQLQWRTESWQMAYDVMDRLTQQESYDAAGARQYQVGLSYNPNGLWSVRTYRDDTQAQSWIYSYDATTRWTGIAYWDDRHDVIVNDANGNQTQIIEEFFADAAAASSQPTSGLEHGLLTAHQFGLVPDQQTSHLHSLAATVTHTTTFEYDATDRLRKATDPAGNWYTFQYDGFDRMIEINSSHYALPKQQYYDALGMEHEIQGAMAANYLYDLAGNVRANALEGVPSQYLHRDPRGQITHISDDLIASLDYCFMGNLQESGVAVDWNVYEPLLSTGEYAINLQGTWQAGIIYHIDNGTFRPHNSQMEIQGEFAFPSLTNSKPTAKMNRNDEDEDDSCGPGDSWWKCLLKKLRKWLRKNVQWTKYSLKFRDKVTGEWGIYLHKYIGRNPVSRIKAIQYLRKFPPKTHHGHEIWENFKKIYHRDPYGQKWFPW